MARGPRPRGPSRPRLVAASDVGGTFTDLVLWDGTRLHTLKRVTDPRDRQRVVLDGTLHLLAAIQQPPGSLVRIIHGTTAATNAVLQRKGGRVGFVTNEGFEDLIEIGRQNRPRLYDLTAVRPLPLAPRDLRLGVAGRRDGAGNELARLDRRAVRASAQRLRRAGVDAVAVGFLHSYADGSHEAEAGRILRSAGLRRITLSHEVAPEPREYERFTTALVNAFLQPVFEDSLRRMEQGFRAARTKAPLFVVESSGGMVSAAEAQRIPVRTVLSGPAGGVAASGELARRMRLRDCLSFDMGGTSTDLAVLRNGRPALRHDANVAGFPLRTPALDLATIGAGGGSIARLDDAGLLRVGPESAEARPGPACYARGGREATVTDADVVLGRIAASGFLGGRGPVRLHPGRAHAALARLGKRMAVGAEAAARAVLDVATANLHRGIRLVTTERGLDPADHALIAFGGAGPLHGLEAAAGLGIRRIVVPAEPAVFSAWGMLVGDVRHDFSATVLVRSDRPDFPKAAQRYAGLQHAALRRMADEGFGRREVRLRLAADLRYVGQSYELALPVSSPTRAGLGRVARQFHAAHRRHYGHSDPHRAVELVAIRLEAAASPRPRPRPQRIRTGTARTDLAARVGERRAFFQGSGFRKAPVVDRRALLANNRVRGPTILEGGDHTFLLPPGAEGRVGPWGDLEVTL